MSQTQFMRIHVLIASAGTCALLAGGCTNWHKWDTQAHADSGAHNHSQVATHAPTPAFEVPAPAMEPMESMEPIVGAPEFDLSLNEQYVVPIPAEPAPAQVFIDDSFFDKIAGKNPPEESVSNPYGVFAEPSSPVQIPVRSNSPVTIYGELPSNLGELATRPATGEAENLSQVSFAPEGSDFDPCISRDGQWIVYASTQHFKTADIYLKPVEGRAITQLTSDPGNDVMPAISPDGSRVAFASDRSGTWDVYVMNRNGGQAVQITSSSSHELHPTWSPDGKFLAYCALGEVSGKWELWVINAVNPSVRHFIGYGLFPEWSPQSDSIAFQRSREQGDRYFSVWTVNFDNGEGSNPTEIASSPVAAVVNPSWSPDGQYLAFATISNPQHANGQRPEQADIWISHIDGSSRANLTGGAFVNLSPTWAQNGQIFFVSDRSGRDNIWALRPLQAIVASGRSTNQNFAHQSENGAATTPPPPPVAEQPTTPEVNLAEVDPDNN